jgi:fatty acid-binding protein DegV
MSKPFKPLTPQTKARSRWDQEKAADMANQESIFTQRIKSLEQEICKMRTDFEDSNLQQLVMSGRITEQLQEQLVNR